MFQKLSFVVFSFLLLITTGSHHALAQVDDPFINWTGLGDGSSWNDDDNWQRIFSGMPGIPGVNDLAFIEPFPFGDAGPFPGGPFPGGLGELNVQVNQPTIAGAVGVTNATLDINANFRADVFAGGGGVVNLNSATLSGSLGLGSGSASFFGGGPADGIGVFNRTGGVLNLTGVALGSEAGLPTVVLDLLASDSVNGGNSSVNENGVLNIEGAAVDWEGAIDGGTVNLNSGTVSGSTTVNFGGALNINGGVLSGDLGLGGFVGTAPILNRTGGTLDLSSLTLIGGAHELVINPTDNITGSVNVADGSQLTINRDLELSNGPGFTEFRIQTASRAFLNGDLTVPRLVYEGDSLVRGDGVKFSTEILQFKGTEYTHDGTDTISRSFEVDNGQLIIDQNIEQLETISASNGSTVNVNAESVLQGGQGFLIGNQSTLNINAETNADNQAGISGGSVLNVNADLTLGSNNGIRVFGSTINLNDGTVKGRMQLREENGVATTYTRSANAVLELFSLEIQGATHVELMEGDSISRSLGLSDNASADVMASIGSLSQSVSVSTGSQLRVLQADGQLDGLSARDFSIDDSSMVDLIFDDMLAAEGELDFALRLDFDKIDLLTGLLDSGRLTFSGAASSDIRVIRDLNRFGDFTYVGYVGGAVSIPEPACSLWIAALLLPLRRNRQA